MLNTEAQYDYLLPKELIANTPAEPRDSSRIFIYNTKTDDISFDTFNNIGKYLPENAILGLNNTMVVPARLVLTKPTGGKVEVFLYMNEIRPSDNLVKGIVDKRVNLGDRLSFPNGTYLEVAKHNGAQFWFHPERGVEELPALLSQFGVTPLPKYIKGLTISENELRNRYQSTFAKNPASVAAPTASLHFTHLLFSELKKNGIETTELTLHVGAGTFAPVTAINFETHTLHKEWGEISKETVKKITDAKKVGRNIIPVGTTALRTLEAFGKTGALESGSRFIDIFIYPPYKFQIADALITNFHLPKTSLMLLVDAFLEHKGAKRRILDLYHVAITERFRFYSFGDAMLIL